MCDHVVTNNHFYTLIPSIYRILTLSSIFLGFRGRTRPNLLRQETTSMMCAIRILYHLLWDENRFSDYDTIESRLLGVINGGLEYFLLLTSEIHREAWTQVLLLILARILQLQPDQVCANGWGEGGTKVVVMRNLIG